MGIEGELIRINPVGTLAPRVGRYRLHAGDEKVPLVRFCHDQPINLEVIGELLDDKYAVFLPHEHIPANFSAPFVSADAKIRDDFTRYCPALVLLPELWEEIDGREKTSHGFNFFMIGNELSEKAFELSPAVPNGFRPDIHTMIFFHPFNQDRAWKNDQTAHWELSGLIGRAKLGQMTLVRDLRLSETESEAFAFMYQIWFSQALVDQNFGGKLYAGACGYFISGLKQMLAGCHLSPAQTARLAGLL